MQMSAQDNRQEISHVYDIYFYVMRWRSACFKAQWFADLYLEYSRTDGSNIFGTMENCSKHG